MFSYTLLLNTALITITINYIFNIVTYIAIDIDIGGFIFITPLGTKHFPLQ